MAQRDAFLHIRVVDENGKERVPGANDEVRIQGNKLTYDAKDGFVFAIKGKQDVKLLVRYKGFADLRQTFEVEAQVEVPSVKPYWEGTNEDPDAKGKRRRGMLLECMSLQRVRSGSEDERSPYLFALTVTLHPTREYVAVIGADYWEGPDEEHPHGHHSSLDFDRGTITFAQHLHLTGVTNISSPMTVLDCQRGHAEVWMRAAGGGLNAWRRHSTLSPYEKNPAPKWKSDKDFLKWLKDIMDGTIFAGDLMGAVDIYTYLSEVGASRPKTLIDFSVFSHAWQGGPILFNTVSQTQRAGKLERDDKDLDMRANQDFTSPNVDRWDDMKKAFAPGSNIHIWGCFATTIFLHMVQHLIGHRGSRFKEVAETTAGKVRLDLDSNEVTNRLKDAIKTSYMTRIAKFTGADTWGGPPGFGADLTEYSTITTIPSGLRAKIGARKQGFVPRTWKPSGKFRKLYETTDFSGKFDIFGYLQHAP